MRLLGSKNLNNPFVNLTFQQHILQTVRLVCPLVALVILIVLFILKGDVDTCYVVRLNCAHVDLAKGIYKILNQIYMAQIVAANSTDLNFFLDSNMPRSTVDAMTSFARGELSDAPQLFFMGFDSYCSVRYDTNYDDENSDNFNLNLSTSCQDYTFNNKLDYAEILKNNGFDFIVSYAYFADDDGLQALHLVNLRLMFKIVSVILFVILPVLIFFTLYVYSNRKGAPDLSRVKKLAHVPLLLSVGACIAMTCSFALIVKFVRNQMLIVSAGLGKFQISMSYGPVFFGLFISSFVLVALTMLFWVVPMWCSNPPVVDRSAEELVHVSSQDRAEDVASAPQGKFSRLLRRKLHKTSNSDSTAPDRKNSKLSLIHNCENDSANDLFNSLKKDASEEELRKLGDQLAYRPHVRKSQAVVLETVKDNSNDSIDEK